MKNRIILLVVLAVVSISAIQLYDMIAKDYTLYKLESACAMKQVVAGIPRRDVKGCGKADYK